MATGHYCVPENEVGTEQRNHDAGVYNLQVINNNIHGKHNNADAGEYSHHRGDPPSQHHGGRASTEEFNGGNEQQFAREASDKRDLMDFKEESDDEARKNIYPKLPQVVEITTCDDQTAPSEPKPKVDALVAKFENQGCKETSTGTGCCPATVYSGHSGDVSPQRRKSSVPHESPPAKKPEGQSKHWSPSTSAIPGGAYPYERYPSAKSGYDPIRNKRWDDIQVSLLKFSTGLKLQRSPLEDFKRLLKSYNPDWNTVTDFETLDNLYQQPQWAHKLREILPFMAELALKGDDRLPSPETQLIHRDIQWEVDSDYLATMLANAFFCTFPDRDLSRFPLFNFMKLFGKTYGGTSKVEKLKCILSYFEIIQKLQLPKYNVFYKRRMLRDQDAPQWSNSHTPIGHMFASTGSIERDGVGMLQVDFANKYVGGGVLGNGALMEEIRFSICPELILSCFLSEKLKDKEVFYMRGFQQFSSYTGYGHSFKFKPLDQLRLKNHTEIVAMDALQFKAENALGQFREVLVDRELNKCFTAFHIRTSANPDIASGNWGCGAFNGDPQLKFLIQLMAASEAGKKLHMFTVHDAASAQSYNKIHALLLQHSCTVGGVYKLIGAYNKEHAAFQSLHKHRPNLFSFIESEISKNSQKRGFIFGSHKNKPY